MPFGKKEKPGDSEGKKLPMRPVGRLREELGSAAIPEGATPTEVEFLQLDSAFRLATDEMPDDELAYRLSPEGEGVKVAYQGPHNTTRWEVVKPDGQGGYNYTLHGDSIDNPYVQE